MYMNSTKMLFNFTLIIGVMLCICSNNWIILWSGLEVMLMSFIPIMINKNLLSSECMMKYFIVQSLSSSLLISGMILMSCCLDFEYLILVSLMIKIGLSPFHNWVLTVVEGLDYKSMFFLLTLMKIGPLMALSYMNFPMAIPIFISLIVGAIFGINQNSIRKMLTFSSIFNLGFTCSCLSNVSIWLTYMFLYTFMLFSIMYIFNKLNVHYLNQIMINEFSSSLKLSIWFMMLSFGGMPPMIGFLSKLLVFEFMVTNMEYLALMIMILSSLVVMFYYMRSTYMMIMLNSVNMKWMMFSSNSISMVFMILNVMLMFIMMLVKSLA
uniref:NADH-ubiquinone oxidoreductase chain 2 n=1 Tax=Kolla paulula TaxID=700811 RepID=A0A8K1VBX7_9HEMI|nr:NADH dehydrogenase subunit 2 [Kolla paulula]